MSDDTRSERPAADTDKRRPDPVNGRRIAMIAVVGALAAGMALLALRDPQAAMDSLLPAPAKPVPAQTPPGTSADADPRAGMPSAFVSPLPAHAAAGTATAAGTQIGPDWEAEVLSGRRSLEQMLIDGDAMRVDVSTQVLESERFADLQQHLQTTAGDSPLAKDYKALAEAAVVDTFNSVGRVRFECSEQICLISASAADPNMDFNGWLTRFQESTGTLGRIFSTDRRPLPGGGYEFRVVMSVDPNVTSAAVKPGG
jgi:hypothetical protein